MTITAVRTTEQVPEDELLGYMAFQNIDNLRIHKDDLGDLFDASGLPRTFLPHEIKPHDAYRRATATATGTIEIDDNGQKQPARLLVREILHDKDRIVRNLVRERVNKAAEDTDYITVGRMIYNRQNQLMDISWDPNYLTEYDYRGVIQDVQNTFIDWTQFHTKDTVRSIMKAVLESTNPVSIQKGGRATFIPKNAKQTLFAAREVVANLPGNTSMIEVLPLIDTEDTRDMIARRAEDTMKAELDELLEKFLQVTSGGTQATNKQLKSYIAKFLVMKERMNEYQALVSRGMKAIQVQVVNAMQLVNATPTEEGEADETETTGSDVSAE